MRLISVTLRFQLHEQPSYQIAHVTETVEIEEDRELSTIKTASASS